MRTALIIFFEPSLTLALIPSIYAPTAFSYAGRKYIQGHGPGSIFLDWLLTAEKELIGLQLDLDIFGLDASGRSKFTDAVQTVPRLAAEKNFAREYISKSKHFVQLWFGSRRDYDPKLSGHQYMVDYRYVTPDEDWAVGASFDSDDENIQKLGIVKARWVSNEIHVLGNWAPPPD